MRILYVGRDARIGGGSTFRLNIAKGLIARGHEVWLACWPGEMLPQFRAHGVRYVWTPPAPWGGPWIERAIRVNRIDLVHASNTTPGTAAEWACKRTGTPMLMSVHGLLGRKDHTATCLQTARRILTFEEVAVKSLHEKPNIDRAKIHLLRRPIEHRPEPLAEEGSFEIVYVGRLSKRKGSNALNLLTGFERFLQQAPESRLRIVGGGSIERDVKREVAALNVRAGREAARFVGVVPDPGAALSDAHVLVGASYCALEAIMQRKAVIGAGFWGYGIITRDNLRDAMAWNFGDVGGKWEMSPENFHDALAHLYRTWRGREGRAPYWEMDDLIVEEHGLHNVAARIEAIYRDILAGVPVSSAAATDASAAEPAGVR